MQLVGEMIQLRALEPSDLKLLYKWENDSSVWSVSGTLMPFSKFVLEEFVNQAHQDIYTNKQLRLMIDLRYLDEENNLSKYLQELDKLEEPDNKTGLTAEELVLMKILKQFI